MAPAQYAAPVNAPSWDEMIAPAIGVPCEVSSQESLHSVSRNLQEIRIGTDGQSGDADNQEAHRDSDPELVHVGRHGRDTPGRKSGELIRHQYA